MSDAIITVENLGKKYTLRHAAAGVRYTALRDVISTGLKRFLGRSGGFSAATNRDEFWALQDVSFKVNQGEVLGIIGRNGAGKSTLLKILSRITEPTRGRITLRGRVASLLEVGTGFHPELTGRENIFLNGAILGMTRAEITRKFDEIVAFAEVERFLDTPVKHYSSGMYVRLAFAVAAHLEPEILVVDEVLAVGDAEFQKKCLQKMNDVARGGRTVLFVSHNMNAITNLCSRTILLNKGQCEFDGSVDSGILHYVSQASNDKTTRWTRPLEFQRPPAGFMSVNSYLQGRQPHLILVLEVELGIDTGSGSLMMAVDICDSASTPIMQALPSPAPFIPGNQGNQKVALEIDLPPLIPGTYTVDVWTGTHFNNTADQLKSVIAFDVTETPSTGRTFPHSANHGWLVPTSRHQVTPI